MEKYTMKNLILIITACFLVSGNIYAANLSYPGDCKASKLTKAAKKNGCSVEAGGEHWKVYKNGNVITTIPHSVKENNTCRAIIKTLNKEC